MRKLYGFCTIIITLILITITLGADIKVTKSKSSLKKIGFSVYDMKYDYFKQMAKGTEKHLKELGYSMILNDQKSDADLEIKGCNELINQGISALIISPINPEVLSKIVMQAREKKIPVIINDIGGGDSDYDALVVSDCIGGGRMAGEYFEKKLKDKNIQGEINEQF